MKRNNRKVILAAAITGLLLGGMTLDARATDVATDVTAINQTSTNIHPYFRSNCWLPNFSTAKPGDWVYFGTIDAHTQFGPWTFNVLMKGDCVKPVLRFSFALDGEAPPTGSGIKDRTIKLELDQPLTTITLGENPVIKSVIPDDDNDAD